MSEPRLSAHIHDTETEAVGSGNGNAGHGGAQRRPPRLYHKKSRTGCQRCRARRVKCNEIHPVCGGCQRHKLPCVYDQSRTSKATQNQELRRSARIEHRIDDNKSQGLHSSVEKNTSALDRETRERRLLELKLLHHFTAKTCLTFPGSTEPGSKSNWQTIMPRLAFKYDSLLYSIYAFAALHLGKSGDSDLESLGLTRSDITEIYANYLDLALREHRKDVMQLNKANADAVGLTSCNLRMIAYAGLQDRPLLPYTPPIQWMQMTHYAGSVFKQAWVLFDNEASVARAIAAGPPNFSNLAAFFGAEHRRGLERLLERRPADEQNEPWTDDIVEAYEQSVSYIGSIHGGINAGEDDQVIFRRIAAFTVMAPKRFIQLVEEAQPRALVVLAHFFGLLAKCKNTWYVHDAGIREVRAIQGALGPEWQDMLSGALMILEESATTPPIVLYPNEETA